MAEPTWRRGTRVVAGHVMRSQLHLVVAPPKLPATSSQLGQLGYLHGALTSPVCLAATGFAACLGGGYAGGLGAVAPTPALGAVGANLSRYPRMREYLDEQ